MKNQKGTIKSWVVVFLMTLILSGGTWYYYERVIWGAKSAFNNSKNLLIDLKSLHFQGDVTTSQKQLKIAANIEGDLDSSKLADPKASSALDLSITQDGASITAKGEFRLVDKILYINASELPAIFPGLEKLENQWIKIDGSTLGYDTVSSECNLSAENEKKLKKFIKDQDIFTEQKKLDNDKVNNKAVRTYSAKFNIEAINAITEYANSLMSEKCKTELSTDQFKDLADLQITLLANNNLMRFQFTGTTTGTNPTTYSFGITVSSYNKPVTVNVPDSAKPIEEVIQTIFGDSDGGDALPSFPEEQPDTPSPPQATPGPGY